MELNYQVNPTKEVGISKFPSKHDALGLASQLPFLKRNYFQNTLGVAYDFVDKDMHYSIMCSMPSEHKIRFYTNILN